MQVVGHMLQRQGSRERLHVGHRHASQSSQKSPQQKVWVSRAPLMIHWARGNPVTPASTGRLLQTPTEPCNCHGAKELLCLEPKRHHHGAFKSNYSLSNDFSLCICFPVQAKKYVFSLNRKVAQQMDIVCFGKQTAVTTTHLKPEFESHLASLAERVWTQIHNSSGSLQQGARWLSLRCAPLQAGRQAGRPVVTQCGSAKQHCKKCGHSHIWLSALHFSSCTISSDRSFLTAPKVTMQ